MAEKSEKQTTPKPEDRFRYIGFEVFPGKVKDLFKSDSEKDQLVQKVKAKREKGEQLREHCTLTVERVAGYEKIVMTVTSLVLVLSLFLPWFSGNTEEEIVTQAAVEQTAPADSLAMAANPADSMPAGQTDQTAGETTPPTEMAAEETSPPTEQESGVVMGEKDEAGFASVTSTQKRTEIKREHYHMSAIGAIGSLGDVGSKAFSSGPVVMITAVLLIIYILLCIAMAAYTLFTLYGSKGNPDQKALALKKAVRYNWIGLGIFGLALLLSFFGGSYSFDSSDMIVQIGGSYGPGTFLGLLSYGFYIAMACFIMNAVKGSEI